MRRVLVITNIRRLFRSHGGQRSAITCLEKDAGEGRASCRTSMKKTRAELDTSLTEYTSIMPASEAEALGELRGAYVRWVGLNEQVTAMSASGKQAEGLALAQTHAKDPCPGRR